MLFRSHLAYFNKHRTETLALRYFQHLSLLISELFLDKRFNHEKTLRKELNSFVNQRNSHRAAMDAQDPKFYEADLTKLAFWMATGSGKTILMHFHYRQFLHYNHEPLDNILLVTPDEGLSQQHLENMEAAGIPCARFSLEESGFEAVKKNTVRVIEITKLVEEKKGSGVSVPVEAFEGNNLIFVDEGHKGASSEAGKWVGLLNIGRSEGTEIIQLFGRGVRLKGLNRTLKRSSVLPPPHPEGIDLLERLNIFAIRANYMAQFRDYLEREGVEPVGDLELKLPIKRNDDFLKKGLIAPRLPKESRFATNERILLERDAAAKVVLDVSVKVESIGSAGGTFQTSSYVGGREKWLPTEQFGFLDWERLYLEMLEFKEERGFHNLVIQPEHPRRILEASDPKLYGLICDDGLLKPKRAEDAGQLQTAMAGVLKKYVESFYRKRQQRWDSSKMVYALVRKDDDNFQDYVIKVPRSDATLIKAVKDIITEGKRIYKEMCADLPGLYLDRHLYQPLLIQKGSKVKHAPPALNESEHRFVQDLIDFCLSKPTVLKDKELFLLRNLSRGKGIGFFDDSGFYPDFILWITQGKSQRLVFIEPHGMRMEDHPLINPKVNLHQKLQVQSAGALKKSKIKNLMLDSFIISATPYDELRKKHGPEWDRPKYADAHIVFFGDGNDRTYIETIIAG